MSYFEVIIITFIYFILFCLSGRFFSRGYKNAFTELLYAFSLTAAITLIVMYFSIHLGFLSKDDSKNGIIARVIIWILREEQDIGFGFKVYLFSLFSFVLPVFSVFIFGGLSNSLPPQKQDYKDSSYSIFNLGEIAIKQNWFNNCLRKIPGAAYCVSAIFFIKCFIACGAVLFSFGIIDSLEHLSNLPISWHRELIQSIGLSLAFLSAAFVIFPILSLMRRANSEDILNQDTFLLFARKTRIYFVVLILDRIENLIKNELNNIFLRDNAENITSKKDDTGNATLSCNTSLDEYNNSSP